MDNNIKNILKYAFVLFVITAISASLLAAVNMLTKDIIVHNAVLEEQIAVEEVMGFDASFISLDHASVMGYGAEAIYIAKNNEGEDAGICIKVAKHGYGGEVISLIGLDMDNKVTGICILSHSETPGLGAKFTDEKFIDQFKGKGRVDVVKAGAKENEVNAVSGATKSSKALADSVNLAVEIATKIKGEGIYLQ